MQAATIAETMENAVRHHQGGHLRQAEQLYRLVLQSDPNHPSALHLLGAIAYQRKQYHAALELIGKAIAGNRRIPQFHNTLGAVLKAVGKFEEAIAAYEEAVLLNPTYAEAYYNMGNALQSQGRYDPAVEKYKQAVSLKPDYAEAYNNMAIVQQMQGRHAEAIQNCSQAIRLKPNYAEAYNTRASALQMQGQHAKAIEYYKRTLLLKPDYAEAHVNLGMTLLLTGKFVEGWAEYRWRRYTKKAIYPHRYEMPRWDGSPFPEKKLFVHYEQGLGDNLQFVRYLPKVKARGGTVIFEVKKSLLGLLRGFPGIDELVEASFNVKPTVEFDFYTSLLDLPRIFGTTLETIPAEVPYLYADPRKVEYWRNKLAEDGFKVGIVWAGSAKHSNDRWRSCVLKRFAPLAKIDGVRLYGLQKGKAAEQVKELAGKMSLMNLADELNDFTDTAGVIENLDLVISVDTAVLHLAGAMGKPVWALLPFAPDWRWMLNRDDSPWYPTMRLFRQRRSGNWDDVFQRVTDELKTITGKQSVRTRTFEHRNIKNGVVDLV